MRKFCFMRSALILLLVFTLVGCGKTAKPSDSGKSSSNTIIAKENSLTPSKSKPPKSRLPEIPSPAAELKNKDKVTVYTLTDGNEIYEATDFPIAGEITVGDIVNMVAETMNIEISVTEITQQKSMVTVNFDKKLIDPEAYLPLDKIKNSVAMTLYENHHTDNVHFQVAGEYPEGFADDRYIPVPLKLIEGTPEEFAAIRAQIPYKQRSGMEYKDYNPILYATTKKDDTAKQLSYLLMRVGLIKEDVASPNELMEKQAVQLLQSMIMQVEAVSTYPEYENYHEAAKPIAASVSLKLGIAEETLYFKEHMEQAAKELFGSDFKLTHEGMGTSKGNYKYFADEGVYTPPHMGGGYNVIPVIVDYTDSGETITAKVVYIVQTMGGYTTKTNGEWGDAIPENELETFVKEKAAQYEVVVKKTPDGGFNFVSCKML